MTSASVLYGQMLASGAWSELFFPGTVGEPLDRAAIESALHETLARARAAWPSVAVLPERFFPYLAKRLPTRASLGAALDAARAGDLHLACECAAGTPEALAAFEKHLMPEARNAVAYLRQAPSFVDELEQQLRVALFVGANGSSAKIVDYTGRGELRNWVRVSAIRLALNRVTRAAPEVPLEDQLLDRFAQPATEPHSPSQYAAHRALFKEAFRLAAADLTSAERNLLRFWLIDGLNIDQIAALKGGHRSTVARRLARVGERLLVGVRQVVRQRLGLSAEDFDSLFRMMRSDLDVSLERLLRSSG